MRKKGKIWRRLIGWGAVCGIVGGACGAAAGIWGERPRQAGFLLLAWYVHELGHWLGLDTLGLPGRVRLWGALGPAVEPPPACQGWRESVVALAGPGANLLVGGVAKNWGFEGFFAANFVMAAVNLSPFLPLDGGKALRGIFSGIFGWHGVSRFLLLWGKGLALAFLGVIYWFGLSRWLILGAAWLYLLACREESDLPYLLGSRLGACVGQSRRPRRRVRARSDTPVYRVIEKMAPGWRNTVRVGGKLIEGDDLVREWLAGRGRARVGG